MRRSNSQAHPSRLPPRSPAVNATCTRFRQALLGDPERWCSFELALPQLWSNREAWLAAKLGLLHQVAGLVESFAMEGVEQLQDWAKNCRGGWSLERFLSRLDPQTLTGLRLEGLTGRQAPLAAAGRFEGLTALELSSSSARLPKNTGAVVGALTELRHLVRARAYVQAEAALGSTALLCVMAAD